MADPIILTIGIYIGPARLLELGLFNVKNDLEEWFREKCIGANWSNKDKIKKAIVMDNNKNDDKEDLWERIGN